MTVRCRKLDKEVRDIIFKFLAMFFEDLKNSFQEITKKNQ